MKRIIETLLTIKSTGSALKRLTLGLAVSAAVVLGTGLSANAAAPANDNFANAINLPGPTGTQTGTDNIDATLEAGEPNPGAANTVWFKWTCTEAGKLTVNTFGSRNLGNTRDWDAILGIYAGASLNALTPLGDTPKDTGYQETMTVPVTNGTTYYIQLAGYADEVASSIVVNWTLDNLDNGAAIETFGANVVGSSAVTNITGPTTGTVDWTVPFGSTLATLAPTFTLSPGATCNQTSGAVPTPNFSTSPVHYIVTAAGGTATRDYAVTVTVTPPSTACDMLTFGANVAGSVAFINSSTVDWYLPYGNAVTALAPTYTLSFGATCVPTSGTTKDFTSPQTYRVTAQDGSTTKDYVVTARVAAEAALVWSAGGGGDWDYITPNWTGQTSGSPQPFANAYNVIFTNTAGGVINVPAAVYPFTTTVSATAGTYTFSGGSIAAGSITKNGAGRLNIDGLLINSGTVVPNTYSGGTIINSGRFHLGGMYAGLSPDITGTVGTGPVTLNGGTLTFDRITETNALISNGGTFASDNGWGVRWNGPITLNADLTIAAQSGNAGTTTLGGAISGTRGLIKTGNITLILSGVNSYAGATTVTAGTLQCNNTNALGSGGALNISGTGKVNLNYTGEHNVASLTLGGVSQTSGTYGSTTSPATNKNDTYFVGTGVVRVPLSSLKNMLTFSFGALGNAAITGTNITMLVQIGTDRTQLAPTYTVSPGANGSPLSGTTHNFTSPQVYTVTAENGSTLDYQVTVSEAVLADVFTWTNTASGNWSVAANWTNENASGEAPFGAGRPSYTFNFNEAGTYTATNDMNAVFQLNQLNLGGPALTLAGNSLAFTANGATLPQLSQNSTVACTISVPVNLANNTTVGGSGSGQVNLNGAISGPGSLTLTNPGTLRVNGAPSYTGGTHVVAGTLYLYAAETGFAPNAAAFNIADVTVESGATLEGYRAHLVGGKLTMNGGTYWEWNGYNDGAWDGPIYLAADSYFGRPIGNCYGQTLRGQISGPGGFTFSTPNAATLTLTASNSYAGPTIVNSGTLRCNNRDALGTGALTITSPGLVNLNYTGDHVVSSVTLDGADYGPGTYGSGIYSAYFAGTGTVSVRGPAQIIAFAVGGYAGVIDHTALTIRVTVPYGMLVTALKPTYTLSSGTCDKDNGGPTAYDFSSPVTYTVTDGAVVHPYTVTFEFSKLTFDALPPVQEWSTLSMGGAAGDITNVAGLDSMVQTNIAANISTVLGSSATVPPSANNLARWNSAQFLLQMRPNSTKAVVLMARLSNKSGGGLYGLTISYDMGTPITPANAEEVPGVRAYYSLTGLANSWTAIPALCTATAGTLTANVAFSSPWTNSTAMYVLWAQDNNAGTDNAYTIDNASFAPWVPPPTTPPTITGITGPVGGILTISGFAVPGNVVTERATRLISPADWTPIQTNAVSGYYSIPIPMGTGPAGFFRTRFE